MAKGIVCFWLLLTCPAWPPARALGMPELPATPQAKRDAQRSGALAVEMEAYPLAAWAAAHRLLFIHARVILDAVDESLPDLAMRSTRRAASIRGGWRDGPGASAHDL